MIHPIENVPLNLGLNVTICDIYTTSMQKNKVSETPVFSILIAEDDPSNYLLFEILLKQDYRLYHANNGIEAIELFKCHHPQLILMDIKMPEMDGYEATAYIRKLSATIPIVAITAYAFPEDKERILQQGFNDYLSKPITPKVLRRKIQEIIQLFPYNQ